MSYFVIASVLQFITVHVLTFVSITVFATLLPPYSQCLQHFAATVHLYRRGIVPLYQGQY